MGWLHEQSRFVYKPSRELRPIRQRPKRVPTQKDDGGLGHTKRPEVLRRMHVSEAKHKEAHHTRAQPAVILLRVFPRETVDPVALVVFAVSTL